MGDFYLSSDDSLKNSELFWILPMIKTVFDHSKLQVT